MILITEFMDQPAVTALMARFETIYAPDLADRQGDIQDMLTETRALIVRNRTRVTAALLAAAPKLECVGRLGVGLDNIDQAACAARGVAVYPATGANDQSVAEYVIATAMVLLRGAYRAGPAMLAGAWPRQACAGHEIAGKRLGLIGYGAIARDTARRAQAIGMQVCGHDPFLAPDDPAWDGTENLGLEDLLARSQVVSLHVPLTSGTANMIDAARLAMMADDAILINAARGGVVDETALADALRAGRLGGAALDVFADEPLTAQGAQKFEGIDTLILTPHVAGVTVESNARVSAMIADRVSRHLSRQ